MPKPKAILAPVLNVTAPVSLDADGVTVVVDAELLVALDVERDGIQEAEDVRLPNLIRSASLQRTSIAIAVTVALATATQHQTHGPLP
jgi:hypothetical protein